MVLGIRCFLLQLASMLRSWMSEMTSMRSTEGLASGTDGSAMETEAEGVMERRRDWLCLCADVESQLGNSDS